MSELSHATKTRENRARRLLRRDGYLVRKDRVKESRPGHWGGYMVVDPSTNFPVAGYEYDLDLDELVAFAEEAPD